MRKMARLFLLIPALLLIGRCSAEGWFEDGQEYQYSYLAYTITGVREPVNTGSSIGISGNLLIQKQTGQAIVKLSDLSIGLHNGQESLLSTVKFQKKPELADLEKPFKVSFLNGKINGLDADSSDTEWSINIKKGLATMLQVDLSSGDSFARGDNNFFRTIEDTIVGMCNTSYSFSTGEKGRQVLVKQRSQSDCTNTPSRISYNTFDATNCAGKQSDDVVASTQSFYIFNRQSSNTFKAHVISSVGHQAIQRYPPAGAPFYNLANTTLAYKSSGPITKVISTGTLSKHYGNLRYGVKRPIPSSEEVDLAREEDFLHPEEPLTQQALRTKATVVLNKLKALIRSAPLEEEKAQDPFVTVAVQLFGSMNLESLNSVYSSVEKDEDLRNLFVEILPLTGSNPAALKIKEMILTAKFTDIEARRAITLIPFHLRLPTEKLLSSYEDLLKENPNIKTKELRNAIVLAFSHLIGVTCNPSRPRPCRTDNINKYGRMVFDSFKNAQSHPEMMVTLQALRNTKQPSLIEKLLPSAKFGAVPRALRPHIIYALTSLGQTNRNKYLSTIIPIILNVTESTEVRIAALGSLFQSMPSFLELQQLVSASLWEKNPEVLNFMVTSIKNYADSKNPCIKPVANQLQMLLRRLAHIKISHFRSSNRVFDFQDQNYGFGGGLQLATVYGEESRAPLVVAGRVNYRIAEYSNNVPLEFLVRLEGVEETYVQMFRRLDAKDFKLDVLKELLLRTLKIQPRQQAPFKVELLIRSHGYTVLYHHLDMEEIVRSAREGKGFSDLVARGLKLTRSMVMLGGQRVGWRPNDLGLPVGFSFSIPGFARHHFAFTTVNQPVNIGRAFTADFDLALQTVTYLVAYNPLGVSQGVIKVRGSRIHVPFNASIGFSPSDNELELKVSTPTVERPLSYQFGSKTVVTMWGKEDSKAPAYLKETCPDCFPNTLVTRGKKYLQGEVLRENKNPVLGMESQVKIYSCEAYTGKASIGKVIMESFKPSEINSHGSVPGFLLMGFMQLRNYFFHYPPMTACFMKAVVHKTAENPADTIEVKLKLDSSVPLGKKAVPGKTYKNVKGSVTLKGPKERQWLVDVNLEAEPNNVNSLINLKVARQPSKALNLAARALCLSVKTDWSPLPVDILETPSFIEPSVHRELSFVWGDAPVNECPKANTKDVSTITVRMNGNITEEQRQAAFDRFIYPYTRCDADRKDAGRSGVTTPLTEACYQAAMHYATPRSYSFDIHYENLSPRGMLALHRVDTIVKAALFPYWDMHAPHGATTVKKAPNAGHIELKVDVDEEEGVDMHVHTDLMHSHYTNVDILKNLNMVLRNARFQMAQLAAVKAGFVGMCNVAPRSVVTFDNVTMKYDLPTCYTLVSADCSSNPKFAVFAKKSGQNLPMAAKIYIGGHTVELIPTGGKDPVEVKVNDATIKLDPGKPYELTDRDDIVQFLTVEKTGARYFVKAPQLRLAIRYTGDDILNAIPATYRAQHCGLCGDYNGQNSRELVAPSGCSLRDATELARSYVLREKCKDNIPTPKCIEGEFDPK